MQPASARLRTVDPTDAGAPFVSRIGTDGGPMRIVVVASGALVPGDEPG